MVVEEAAHAILRAATPRLPRAEAIQWSGLQGVPSGTESVAEFRFEIVRELSNGSERGSLELIAETAPDCDSTPTEVDGNGFVPACPGAGAPAVLAAGTWSTE